MPRIKGSPEKCIKTYSDEWSNDWVFVLKGKTLDTPEDAHCSVTSDIVKLRHPQTGAPAMFLFSSSGRSVYEVITFSENNRSWFIEDTVNSDGKLRLSTPVDPLFLVLSYLRKAAHVMPIDQLLKDEGFPETERLLKCVGLKYLYQVADRKGDEDLNAYKYNEEKTLSWLKHKIENVAKVLKHKAIQVSNVAASANFVKSGNSEDDSDSYLRYAHGIISEYLQEDLSLKLANHIGLADFPQDSKDAGKRKSNLMLHERNGTNSAESKKARIEEPASSGELDFTKPEKVVKPNLSAKEKARAKAAAGTRNISTFFKKK